MVLLMNRRQKLVQQQFLNNEAAVIKRLDQVYKVSLNDINAKIENLQLTIDGLQLEYDWLDSDDPKRSQVKSMIQSKIYQKNYQEALQGQVEGILNQMKTKQFLTVSDYLGTCYEDGFVGSIFDLHGQGVPMMIPLDQTKMVRAVQLDSKISEGLYTRLGEDVNLLKKKITAQVSRSIATGTSFAQTAKQLVNYTRTGYNNSIRIVRTEGHRIQCSATMDAMEQAKERGADVVKQWDATLDGRTRDSHAALDGEIREADEEFSNGLMFPGDPAGSASEVVNCRCAVLQRARWVLDEDELQTLKDRAAYFGLDKTDDFEDFKKKYLKATEKAVENSRNAVDNIPEMAYIDSTYGATHAAAVKSKLQNADPDVKAVWNRYQGKFKTSNAQYSGNSANYNPASDSVTLDIAKAASGSSYQTPYQVLFHEYGHMTDYLAAREAGFDVYTAFSEIFNGVDATGKAIFTAKGTGGLLGRTAKQELKDAIKSIKKTHGVTRKADAAQILIDEIKNGYSLLARSDVSDMLEGAGIGVAYPLGVGHGKSYWTNRDNGKEIFAEIISAEAASPESLDCIKKYFPETYKVFRKILEVIK